MIKNSYKKLKLDILSELDTLEMIIKSIPGLWHFLEVLSLKFTKYLMEANLTKPWLDQTRIFLLMCPDLAGSNSI